MIIIIQALDVLAITNQTEDLILQTKPKVEL